MSERKRSSSAGPLARLTAIEAPEFLDQLVLGQARAILAEHATRAGASRAEPPARPPKPVLAPVAALFSRLLPPHLKSS